MLEFTVTMLQMDGLCGDTRYPYLIAAHLNKIGIPFNTVLKTCNGYGSIARCRARNGIVSDQLDFINTLNMSIEPSCRRSP